MQRIAHDLLVDPTLSIATKHGIVTIRGEVDTRSVAILVERRAAAAEGLLGLDVRLYWEGCTCVRHRFRRSSLGATYRR
jgi:hypothetical protein